MLHTYAWNAQEIITKYTENANEVLLHCRVKPLVLNVELSANNGPIFCAVCADLTQTHDYSALVCGHNFCNECWARHFQVQITRGLYENINCKHKLSYLLILNK